MLVNEQVRELARRVQAQAWVSSWSTDARYGAIGDTTLRSVFWRCAAGHLSCDEDIGPAASSLMKKWKASALLARKGYEKLKRKVYKASMQRNSRLVEAIESDLSRLYPDGCEPSDFFVQPKIAGILQNVLYVWCELHPNTSYRQGMHELAATVLYCAFGEYHNIGYLDDVDLDNVEPFQDGGGHGGGHGGGGEDESPGFPKDQILARNIKSALFVLLDANFLEHDIFWLFERIMRDLEPLYLVAPSDSGSSSSSSSSSSSRGKELPILELCKAIQYDLLNVVDGELCGHLKQLAIEPQLYGLRWFRLLFTREFLINHALLVWDALFVDAFAFQQTSSFSASPPSTLLRLKDEVPNLQRSAAYFALALLRGIRNDLLRSDNSEALQLLMRLPPQGKPFALVQDALLLQRRSAMPDPHAVAGT